MNNYKIVEEPKEMENIYAIFLYSSKLAFFCTIIYQSMPILFTDNKEIKTLATNGENIFFDINFFHSLSEEEIIFGICHEIGHLIFSHMIWWKRSKEKKLIFNKEIDLKIVNCAGDYIINDMLAHEGLGKIIEGSLHDKKIATYDSCFFDVYKKLLENKDKIKEGLDLHICPDADITEIESNITDAIINAASVANSKGNMPEALGRIINQVTKITYDWKSKLRNKFENIAIGSERVSWKKPNITMLALFDMYMPKMIGTSLNRVVIVFDTSGSISKKCLSEFVGYCHGMFSSLNSKNGYELLYCNTNMYHHIHANDSIDIPKNPDFLKGGGTDMVSAIKYANKKWDDTDAILILTDGHTPEPEAKDIKNNLIWATTENCELKTGVVVKINIRD